MILDGVVPPILVLPVAATLLAGRRGLRKSRSPHVAAPSPWTDVAIAVLIVGAWAPRSFWQLGALFVYQHGPVRLWSGNVQSCTRSSKKLFDPYALTHVTHGVLLQTGRPGLVTPGIRTGTRVVLALGLETAWEVFENTDMVIQRYRATTVSLGYYGGQRAEHHRGRLGGGGRGAFSAALLPVWLLVLGLLLLEGNLAAWIRDNLTLNVLMPPRPVEAIRGWQQLGG